MQNSQNSLEPREPRSISLPLRTLILGSNLILVLGLVLGVALWPYFLKSLSQITGPEKGTITYGQFKQLSPEMRDVTVLATAREPYDTTTPARRVYFRTDGNEVTLWFEKGKLGGINEDRVLTEE